MSAPLEHLKILDFSTLLPGPYATMMLADLGADVIRIQAPNRSDLMDIMPPFDEHGISSAHALLNRSKRNLSLNLKAPGSVEIVKLIIQQGYNIIVEPFRPGVMDRLGVGYESLKELCPELIFCSLTGYGQNGPYRDRAGHDLNFLALSGLMSYYGRQESPLPPPPLPMQVADIGAGSLHLVIGLLAAVIRRHATGEGARVDISMLDGSLAFNSLGAAHAIVSQQNPEREAMTLNGGIFYDLYETEDGRLLSVAPLEAQFWAGFCEAIERPDLIKHGMNFNLANQQTLKDEIREAIQSKTLAEWRQIFAQVDVCVEAVLSTTEALEHPQTQARQMVVDVPRPNGSEQQQIGTPIKLSNHSPEYKHIGVKRGTHSKQILSELGFSEYEIEALAAEGVIQIFR